MPAKATREEQAQSLEKLEICFVDAESKLYRTAKGRGIENSLAYCVGAVRTTVFG